MLPKCPWVPPQFDTTQLIVLSRISTSVQYLSKVYTNLPGDLGVTRAEFYRILKDLEKDRLIVLGTSEKGCHPCKTVMLLARGDRIVQWARLFFRPPE